ncbi:Spy/CpxP family protein refolding chaperone [Caulobacter sp. RHG1]|uniref:Spy/CpxP family protein refolding chaperone n=1 Tax=Caulobacter sp. (strain RHG1) TaxID=2545762 RepID=UPI00188525BD|nr:periplasmic heavy metal sensor [Caulobacter sp. RHG1]
MVRSTALTLCLSLIVAVLGVWTGARLITEGARRPALHELVHHGLRLSAEQKKRIADIERDHETRRLGLEAEMRTANIELAQAIQETHAYTPEVQRAIDRVHGAMGALQKETIVHTVVMRRVLTPQQAARFDQAVVRSLTENMR